MLLIVTISFAEQARTISTEEYLFALSLFPREFPAQYEITITDGTSPANGAYYVRPTIGGIIGAGYIRMNMGNLYQNCLANRAIFAHELTHAWQIKHYGLPWYAKEFVGNHVLCNIKTVIANKTKGTQWEWIKEGGYAYTCDVNKKLDDYNAEQQGDIISHYYLQNACETNIASRALSSTTWKLMIGSDAKDVAQSDNGNLYITNTAGKIYQYNGIEWSQMQGSDAVSIAANAGKVVITNTAGKIYQLVNNSWQQMPGSDAVDVAVNSTGQIWMVNNAGKIYTYDDRKWIQMQGGDAVRIAAGGGMVYITNTTGKIYKHNGTGWSQIVGSDAKDITVDNNGLTFITNTVGKIYQYSGNGSFNQLDGSDGKMVSACNGKLIMVNSTGRIFYRQF
jgi:Tectonin domain